MSALGVHFAALAGPLTHRERQRHLGAVAWHRSMGDSLASHFEVFEPFQGGSSSTIALASSKGGTVAGLPVVVAAAKAEFDATVRRVLNGPLPDGVRLSFGEGTYIE